ncbi:MAG: manganese transporter [Flavobacteriaceae bacterium TMED68]|nr:MAG: manganese transporter [Flavobacteriaceae bacterium TMED68]|tara:strand:- start:139 stop:1359 length:1221 start_codon:yes stop_codon:yes gene_type:complete
MFKKISKYFGPGPIIAAAFIGPGTVTLCSLAGAKFGMSLLWTIIIAILIAIILQSMAIKVSILAKKNLTQAIKEELKNPIVKNLVLGLILIAILFGNTAYEAGNISGTILGIETLLGEFKFNLGYISFNFYALAIGIIAASLLWTGKYKIIQGFLIGLVIIMSISFLATVFFTKPSIGDIISGLLSFEMPKGSLLTIVGLIGTTIVPYNLFLHSELAKNKWLKSNELEYALNDLYVSIGLGGVISLCIIISASGIENANILGVGDLALGLEPLFGKFAKYFLAIGLFSAGITSTITAPMAASYVVCACFGWTPNLKSAHFRITWIFIILSGVLISALGLKLISVIEFAQIANGILLPIIVIILLWIMNKSSILGNFKYNIYQNLIGSVIVIISFFLSFRTLLILIN